MREFKAKRNFFISFQKLTSKCPRNARLFSFTSAEQKTILSLHNEVRNLVASGNHKLYYPAKRMAFMQWNDTLAYVASFNVKTCTFAHDDCRNTGKEEYFKEVNKNIRI